MSKGKRREKQAAELYEAAGFETFRPQESKYGETDMFGKFDIFVMPTPDSRSNVPRLAQVKCNRPKGYSTWFAECVERFSGAEVVPELLACYDREGWRLIGLCPDLQTCETFVDERETDEFGDGVVEYLTEFEDLADRGRPFGVTD